jgi:hypothetical protein
VTNASSAAGSGASRSLRAMSQLPRKNTCGDTGINTARLGFSGPPSVKDWCFPFRRKKLPKRGPVISKPIVIWLCRTAYLDQRDPKDPAAEDGHRVGRPLGTERGQPGGQQWHEPRLWPWGRRPSNQMRELERGASTCQYTESLFGKREAARVSHPAYEDSVETGGCTSCAAGDIRHSIRIGHPGG